MVTHIKRHPVFEREGNDIILEAPVPVTLAMTGGEIDVPTIDGKTVKMKIPAGTESGQIFRLKERGMPYMGGYGKGDQHVVIQVKIPKNMSRKARELVQELNKELTEASYGESVFSRIKAGFR